MEFTPRKSGKIDDVTNRPVRKSRSWTKTSGAYPRPRENTKEYSKIIQEVKILIAIYRCCDKAVEVSRNFPGAKGVLIVIRKGMGS